MASVEQPSEPERPRRELLRFLRITWPAYLLWALVLSSLLWGAPASGPAWRAVWIALMVLCLLFTIAAVISRVRLRFKLAAVALNLSFPLVWLAFMLWDGGAASSRRGGVHRGRG
jgi:hypothetical protein